jgi:hypothetical protein
MRTEIKMMQLRMIAPLLLACIALPAVAQTQQAQQTAPPAVDPNAIAALEKMGAYLRTIKSFEINAKTSTDEVLDNGMKVLLDSTANMKVRRPDRLRVDLMSDRKDRSLFYDGKTITLYGPRVKYYASASAPSTISETVQVLAQKYGIEVPLADLFVWGTEQAKTDDIRSALHLGPATVDGTKADQYAFRQEGVDWQIWIQKGSTPLPLKLVVTTTSEAAQPQHVVLMRWNLAPKFDDSTFAFKPPQGVMRIALQTADGKIEAAGK